jgi:hypothetical protein
VKGAAFADCGRRLPDVEWRIADIGCNKPENLPILTEK